MEVMLPMVMPALGGGDGSRMAQGGRRSEELEEEECYASSYAYSC